MNDDRKKFLKNIAIQSTRLGKSKKILKESLNFSNQVNFYDYSYLWTWFGVPIIQTPTKRANIWYKGNEPMSAAKKFLRENKNFQVHTMPILKKLNEII